MTDFEAAFGKTVTEIERLLSTRTVVGEPITVDGRTLIPLVSVGFGFGVGGGAGAGAPNGTGSGGTGGGGGVKPVGVVVIDKDTVRVEPLKGAAASLVDKVADAAARIAAREKAGPAT
jgi:uncharacterized spore protein YtfJ